MEDKAERAILKGQAAEQLLSDPLIQEAFNSVEHGLFDAWKSTGGADAEARERLWIGCRTICKVRDYLGVAADEGRAAVAKLAADEALKAFDKLNQTPGETAT